MTTETVETAHPTDEPPQPSRRSRFVLPRNSGRFLLVGLLVLVLFGYIVNPLLVTILDSLRLEASGGGSAYPLFFQPTSTARAALLTSLRISVLSVAACGAIGLLVAMLLQRFDFPGRRALEVLALVPIALPPLIGVVAFVFLYSPSGILPRAAQELLGTESVPLSLQGVTGVVVVHAFTMYPFFYLPLSSALRGLDPSLEEAAYDLGASRWHWWTKVLLPMLTPALVSGALLVFMISMASYTAPLLFGVERTMTMQIYVARTNGDLALAATHSTVLSLVSIMFLLLIRWYQDRRSYRSVSKGSGGARRAVTGAARWLAMLGSFLATIVLLAPIATLVLIALSVDGTWTVEVLPPEYSLDNFVTIFTDDRAFRPIWNSIRAAAVATAAGLVLGVGAAIATTQLKVRGSALLDIGVMLPWALPGTVIGINLISAFNEASVFSFGQVVVGTFWILPLAYFVRFSPLVFRSTAASLTGLDPSLDEAARNLGASWFYTFRHVTLPLVARGVAAGALLAFVLSVGEFVASVLIYTVRSQPLSVEIFNRMYSFNYGTAAAYGLLQVLLILGVLIASRVLQKDSGAVATVA